MVTLPWIAFYQKLPAAPGAEWRFECLADGHSWGGSQGVHESSSWGHLVFNLKPAEIAAFLVERIPAGLRSGEKATV